MSRRSRRFSRAVAGQGGPYISPSLRLPLTLKVRRFVEVAPEAERVPQPFVARDPRRNLQVVHLAARRAPEGPRRRAAAFSLFNVLGVRAPERALFCVRRKSRREVLFALRRAGFSGSAPKKHYRRVQDSQYRC